MSVVLGRSSDGSTSSLQDKVRRLEKKVTDLESKLGVTESEGRSEACRAALRSDLAAKEYSLVELGIEKSILVKVQNVSSS